MKSTLLMLLISISCLCLNAQREQRIYRQYATQKVQQRLLKENPQMVKKQQQIEQQIARFKPVGKMHDLTIPLIFHIVHHKKAERISIAQIESQLTALNEAFTARIPEANNRLVADTKQGFSKRIPEKMGIQFCLAAIKQGNLGGVNYISSTKSEWGDDDAIKDKKQGGADAIQPNKYLNIWIANMADTVSGYAQMPGGPSQTDGIVIDYELFGTIGTAKAPYHLGKTLTHLVGSYLGLYELWNETVPCGDDKVSDTPVHNAPNYGPTSNYRHISTCFDRPTEMSMNYMDNSDDAFLYMMTIGQMIRMRAMLAKGGARYGLVGGNVRCSVFDTVLDNELTERSKILSNEVPDNNPVSLRLFPNPANKALNIEFTSTQSAEGQLSLITLQGQVLKEKALQLNEGLNHQKLDISKLPAGIYLIKVKVDQLLITESLIVQH